MEDIIVTIGSVWPAWNKNKATKGTITFNLKYFKPCSYNKKFTLLQPFLLQEIMQNPRNAYVDYKLSSPLPLASAFVQEGAVII